MLKVVNLSDEMIFAGWTKVFCLKTLEKFDERTINSSLNTVKKIAIKVVWELHVSKNSTYNALYAKKLVKSCYWKKNYC